MNEQKDIFTVFHNLENILHERIEENDEKPKKKKNKVTNNIKPKRIQTNSEQRKPERTYTSKQSNLDNNNSKNPLKLPPRHPSPVEDDGQYSKVKKEESKLVKLYFWRWVKRFTEKINNQTKPKAPERKPAVSFKNLPENLQPKPLPSWAKKTDLQISLDSLEEEDTISQINLDETSPIPGDLSGMKLSGSELIDTLSDLGSSGQSDSSGFISVPKRETLITDFNISSYKQGK